MSSTVGGGAATMTRLATTVPRPVRTCTRWCFWTIRWTGACSATTSPSLLASLSGIRCEPPTKRRSCAPLAVSELLEKVPLCCSSPEHATYQSVKRNDSSLGSAPKPGWVQQVITFSMPAALSALAWIHWLSVIESHSWARGCAQGAATSISAAYPSICWSSSAASTRIVGSGGTVPGYSSRPIDRGQVDAVAGVVLQERRHAELLGQLRDVVLRRADEGAAGLDDLAAVLLLGQVMVEHPAADPLAGLDHEHGPALAGDLASRDEAGDPGADHDDVDLLGERTLAGRGEDGGLRLSGQYAGAEQRGAGGGAAEQGCGGRVPGPRT